MENVRNLWVFLRAHGIDARLDRVAAEQRQDWTLWMNRQIREADFILLIASSSYRKVADDPCDTVHSRGVQWEARLIRDAFYQDQRRLNRFVPVVLPGESEDGLPRFLAPNTSTVYVVDEYSVAGAEKLLRLLLSKPAEVDVPLGLAPSLAARRERSSEELLAALATQVAKSDRCPNLDSESGFTNDKCLILNVLRVLVIHRTGGFVAATAQVAG